MSEQENQVRVITRAARKRVAASMPPTQHPNKKRTVLGELTNVAENPLSDSGSQKPRTRSKKPDPKPMIKPAESNSSDPQMCAAYVADIDEYLRSMEIEKKRRPLANYLETIQRDITANMRGILVDWLVEVAQEYKILSYTLYLAVSYLDGFLSKFVLNRQRLQLLGVSCMLIASKYEEISPPNVEEFCYITDYTYTKQEVVKMEADVLKYLNFEMGNPTAKTFLERYTRVAQETCKIPKLQLELLSCYLAELSLLDYSCVKFLPSVVAASVLFLAKFTVQPMINPWNMMLMLCTGYKASDLKECVIAIQDLQLSRRGGSLVAVRDKYKQSKFKSVATLLSPSDIPTMYFDDVEN